MTTKQVFALLGMAGAAIISAWGFPFNLPVVLLAGFAVGAYWERLQ